MPLSLLCVRATRSAYRHAGRNRQRDEQRRIAKACIEHVGGQYFPEVVDSYEFRYPALRIGQEQAKINRLERWVE